MFRNAVSALPVLAAGLVLPLAAGAAAPGCGQAVMEHMIGAPPPPGASASYIVAHQNITPIYQWENNNGYCGESTLIMAGLADGQWMSQFNARLICGAFLGRESRGSGPSLRQAGISHPADGNYNAQLLIQDPRQGLSGINDYGWGGRCVVNAGLTVFQYPSNTGDQVPNTGREGYKDFMSWVKAQTIAHHQVTFGVMLNKSSLGGEDEQYDHVVHVIKIGTNHSPADPTYYPDDVIYFDDHGLLTLERGTDGTWSFGKNPAIPPGAGNDATGCTPYIYGYRFDSFVRTPAEESQPNAPAYAMVMPDAKAIVRTVAGNTDPRGKGVAVVRGRHDFAFAIGGPVDTQAVTMPVSLTILRTHSRVNGSWVLNPPDMNSTPAAGYAYETPYIGGEIAKCDRGKCITNAQPAPMRMVLQAIVGGLTSGVAYNLYEYDFPTPRQSPTGTAAALPIPTADFNAQAKLASAVTAFTAAANTYKAEPVIRSSHQLVVFRAVPASAP